MAITDYNITHLIKILQIFYTKDIIITDYNII